MGIETFTLALRKLVVYFFQHCYICGRSTRRLSHFCLECRRCLESTIANSQAGGTVAVRSPTGHSLVALGSYQSVYLAAAINALKGGDFREDLTLIAHQLIRTRLLAERPPLPTPVLIVPCPSRIKSGYDHAVALALAIGELTCWEVGRDFLSPSAPMEHSQKQKKRGERLERRFLARPELDLSPYGTILFVDDVVTTGATTRAAWSALGEPENFEVWCVAYQPRLAGKEAF